MALQKLEHIDDPRKKSSADERSNFFEQFFSKERSVASTKAAHAATSSFLERQDKRFEERLLLKRIANNTDTIVDLLRSQAHENKNSNSLADLLKFLLPGLLMAPGLISPEKTKPIATIVKAAPKILNGGAKATSMLADAAAAAGKGAKYVDGLGGAAKVLGKFGGKLSDNPILNKAVRYSSLGMIGGRAWEGDYLGAGGEAASLAMHEASRKVKSPKAKAVLSALSLGTDAALIARDFIKGSNKEESPENGETIKKAEEESGSSSGLLGAGVLMAGAAVPLMGSIAKKNPAAMLNAVPVTSAKNTVSPIVEAAKIFKKTIGEAGSTVTAAAKTAGTAAAAGGVLKTAAKFGGKVLPGVGLAMGAAGAISRASEGDYLGAAGEAVSGLVSLIPGLGTATSIAIQSGLAYRDYVKETSANTAELNTITKDSTNALQKTAEENGNIVKETNGTIIKNSNDMSDVIKKTDTSLLSFTNIFGSTIGGWLANSTLMFSVAFKTLTLFSSSIASSIKNFGSGLINKFTDTGTDGAYTGTADKQRLKSELGKGIISKGASGFGAVSAAFESGSRGVRTISTGKGDKGGVSYGKHQMIASTMTDFLNSSEGSGFKKEFVGLKPGTKEFNDKYAMVAKFAGERFEGAQKKYIDRTHYGVASDTLRKKHGLDLNKRGIALREAVYSTSVQYNPARTAKWIGNIVGKNADKMSDEAIINALYAHKAANVGVHFQGSSAETKQAVSNRIQTEKQMLQNIEKVNGGFAGSGAAPNNALGTAGKTAAKSNASSTSGAQTKDNKNAGINADWNLDKLAEVAYGNAQGRKATGECAKYVRMALQKAQVKTLFSGGLGNAKDYASSLPKIKWQSVGNNLTSFKKGDIAVFPKTGSTAGQKYGHVAIFTGSVWVSDHIQKSIQPNASLGNFPYSIWRAISGVSNGTAVGGLDGVSEEDNAKSGLGTDGQTVAEDVNPLDAAINGATTALASVVTALGNSETLKSALSFVNNAKIDEYTKRKGSDVDMEGFSKISGQEKDFKYKFGNGGGIDEDVLFNPNLERQMKGQDILGEAGKIPGIVRQLPGQDILGEAGKIPGVVRQEPGQDILGQAGAIGGIQRQGKSKKKKWYDRLFSGKNAGFFGDLAKAFGFEDQYNLASEVYGVHSSGRDLGDWAEDKAAKKLDQINYDLQNQKRPEIDYAPGILSPDIEGRNKVDGYITETNIRYNDYKRNGNSSSSATSPEIANMPSTNLSGKGNNNIDGLSAPLITRNPDSIFRAVCISIMKATTT